MSELDRALVRLEKLIEWANANQPAVERNEAATRFHLIDELLTNVLRWPRDQIHPEDYRDGKYADYVLGDTRRLVVEAKREGRVFTLPPETATVSKLATLTALSVDVKETVEQVLEYAQERGLPYAAVTNGHQLIAFQGARTDGTAPLDGMALVFTSLAEMRENFDKLWDGLSRAGVEGHRLTTILAPERPSLAPFKLSSQVPGYPGFATPSEIAVDLHLLSDVFLIDIVEQDRITDEFLRDCYCPSGALAQHASVSRDILKSKYSGTLSTELEVSIEPARAKKTGSADLLSTTAGASLTTRPIVLLGYVGVGKTMFIRHLVRVEAKDVIKNALVLYVNLGSEPALEALESYITESFIESLRDRHTINIFEREIVREVYKRDLQDFADGVWGALAGDSPSRFLEKETEYLAGLVEDRPRHLRRSLEHLAHVRGRQVITILDNIDQREAPYQDRVFVIAETLAKSWPSTVFVALRPDTFDRSKKAGVLSAYQPRVFAVAPPRVDRVIAKRIAFARKQIAEHGRISDTPLQNSDVLDEYLELLTISFRRSDDLTALVENLSGGNIRRALELLTTFVSSPHADPERTLKIFRQRGGYIVPFHMFLRAVMLGDRARFDPRSSRVANLLDISSEDSREHFLLPIIIAALRQRAQPGANEGYVRASEVYSACQDLGYLPEQITWHLERAVASDLIEASPLDGSPELFRATMTGSYTEQRLLGEFTYLDEVLVDTPVVDKITRAVLEDVRATSMRVQRTLRFCAYLDTSWRPLAGRNSGFDWAARSASIRGQAQMIEARLDGTSTNQPDRKRPTPKRSNSRRKPR